MSSKDLLMRAFAGVFFQKSGQHFHIHTVVLLIFDLVKQLFEFFALQCGNRSLHIYLCLFSGAGKNHQMFHLAIIDIIFRENTAYRIDPQLPGNKRVGKICLFAVRVHSAPFFVPLLPILGSGFRQAGEKRNSIKSDQHLIKMGGSAIQFQIQVCQNPKLPDRSVAFKNSNDLFSADLGIGTAPDHPENQQKHQRHRRKAQRQHCLI